MVGRLPEGGEGDSAVQGLGALLAKDEVESVGGVAVFRDIERVGHRVHLRLKTDLDDLHGANDRDGFRYSSSESSCASRA